MFFTVSVHAQIKEFEQNVVITMGQRESQDEVRVFALAECKRLVLEKVGVHLTGSTDIVRQVRESEHDFQDETNIEKRVRVVTAGVTKTEIVGEWWVVKGTAIACSLTCRVTVNTSDVQRRIKELLHDRQKLGAEQELLEEVSLLRNELAELRQKLEAKPSDQVESVKNEIERTVAGLAAADWYNKGVEASDPDSQFNCYNQAIKFQPNYADAYNNRGVAYNNKGLYDAAIADYTQALRIDPNYAAAYYNRGIAYLMKGAKRNARQSLEHARDLGHPTAQEILDKYCR